MLIFLTIALVVFIVINLFTLRILVIQLDKIKVYEGWIREFKEDVKSTYDEIKELDDKNIFVKDDEVGVVFQDILEIIKKLNERTE
jgi:hypothetical protein